MIAAQLPGRTDNEMKSYWKMHPKKQLWWMKPHSAAPLRMALHYTLPHLYAWRRTTRHGAGRPYYAMAAGHVEPEGMS
jgi:hypothetical protein